LQEKHRAPLILCDIEGLTQEQAASRLRLSVRTLQRRLTEARDRLKARLKRSPEASMLIGPALGSKFNVPPSPSWIDATARAAVSSTAAIAALRLADETLRSLTMAKLKIAAAVLLV